MTTTIKAVIFPSPQVETKFDSNPMHFLNEYLASVPVSGIPEEFRKLSRYLPVIVLVPKSAVHDKTTQKKPGQEGSDSSHERESLYRYRPQSLMIALRLIFFGTNILFWWFRS
jgi:hypothetical protein